MLAVKKTGENEVLLRMFNCDGSEDFCGNGLRCAAMHCHFHGWVGDQFVITHFGRRININIVGDLISSRLGRASYIPSEVPVITPDGHDEVFRLPLPGGRVGSSLTTGSTHTVVWVDQLPDDSTFKAESTVLEQHPMFPERTSVIWAQVLAPDHIKLRIWERGVGETWGCGSGSTAAAADYLRHEGRAGRVRVDNPGGTVFVQWDPADNSAVIEGEAFEVFTGVFSLAADFSA